jgi:oligo-alginate lyase
MFERVLLYLLLVLLFAATGAEAKQSSRLVTAAMRANALENVQRCDWAKSLQQSAMANASAWVKLSDEELWKLIPSQELPRAVYIVAGVLYEGKPDACPKCGKPINYSVKADFWKHDWKVTCASCNEVFPKNDFAAYYKSALDEHGYFRRGKGDPALLFNAEHPDPQDPLHKLYVDDGYGMTDEKGQKYHVVAYYAFIHWGAILAGTRDLAWAYALTSDPRYAHKAAVLLDRIADVYPDMDYDPLGKLGFQHSHGGSLQGRIQGNIWETTTAEYLSRAYDLIYDGIQQDEALVKFSTEMSQKYKLSDKSSVGAICRHVEDHLLLEFLKAVKDGRIDGNTGMTHTCLTTTAIALDRPGVTEEWLDWLFDPNFPVTNPKYSRTKDPVPWVMVEGLDQDGMGGECGGYGTIWTRSMAALAEALAAYPSYTRHNIAREYPKLKQCYLVETRLNVLDSVMPNLGDTGGCGTWGRAGSANLFARGYKLLHDPQLGVLAWRYAKGNPAALRLSNDIFERDPDALAREIQALGQLTSPKLVSDHLGRYGQAYLQTEDPENGRAIYLHFGYSKGHSHSDCLTLGLLAKNVDMAPDHGYPAFTGGYPQRIAWTSHTVSHNTLLVGDVRSSYSPGGKLNLFAVRPPLRVMDVSAPTAYAGMKTYRRTVALVDISDDDSYVVDVFRARGGKNHRLIYDGAAATAAIEGLTLTPQGKGTFAGPEVEYTTLPGKGETTSNTSGFSYLNDVARSATRVEAPYTVDWKIEDLRNRIAAGKEPHLRLHALTACDEVALASGQPPQNKSGNPKSLRYLIQSRLGDKMESQFVTVLEPYDKTPFIRQVRRLKVEHPADANSVAAVAVDLADGRTDIVISCETPTEVTVEGGIKFNGTYGLVRMVGGRVQCLRMVGGTLLQVGEVKLTSPVAAYTGHVKGIDVSDPAANRVLLDPALPKSAVLVGQVIHFKDVVPGDTSYDIKAVGEDWISTGPISLIAGFKNPRDFTAGYRYLVNVGDEYVLPTCGGLDQ